MTKPARILSIDALRGFDMLLIIFADHFFFNLNEGAQTSFTAALAKQFNHPEWFGSTFYDIIMPLFLFVVGAVIPFSLSKRMQNSTSKGAIYRKLIRRFIILFILGWIVQGDLLAFDINEFHIFSNTLQAIAVGYLFTCIAYIHLSRKWRFVLFAACLIIYALLLTVPNVPGVGKSVLLPDQNFALYFDRLILGKFDDGLQYTWLLSGLGFIATTLSGLFAGELIKSNLPRKKISTYLFLAGIAGVVLGVVWGIWHPIVKKIWTSSFVLASSGVCFILLALFYWVIDVKGKTKWTFPLKVIGMNAITAYVLSHVINFREIAGFLLFGLEKYTGGYYPMILSLGGFGILYLLLWYMYKNNTFIKV
ncbi:acyltransferase family protein [Flagellimonas sp.]|uniref:acyltransferase family protein n=1 Tax=Flagellimonas sp. TaxID=2058762 RepID=UPI003B58C7E1